MMKLKVWLQSIKYSIAQLTVFRGSFFIFFGWLFLDTIIKIAFFTAIYTNVDTIGGWNYSDTLLLVVISSLMWDFVWMFFLSAFEKFLDDFTTGNFDFVLIKPMHPLSYITLTGFSAPSFSGARIPIVFYVILITPIAWHLQNALAAIVIFLASLVALHALFAIMATIAFWVVEANPIYDLFYNIVEGAKYPISIYPMALRFVFTFLIPIFFIGNFPVMAIKNMINLNMSFVAIAVAVALELIAYKAWDWGIKHYSSASS